MMRMVTDDESNNVQAQDGKDVVERRRWQLTHKHCVLLRRAIDPLLQGVDWWEFSELEALLDDGIASLPPAEPRAGPLPPFRDAEFDAWVLREKAKLDKALIAAGMPPLSMREAADAVIVPTHAGSAA